MTGRTHARQLRVSVVPSFAAQWLLPRIGRFFAAHQEIDVDVSANNLMVDFRRDEIDVAICHGYGDWTRLVSEYLLDNVYFPVSSPRLRALAATARGLLPFRQGLFDKVAAERREPRPESEALSSSRKIPAKAERAARGRQQRVKMKSTQSGPGRNRR